MQFDVIGGHVVPIPSSREARREQDTQRLINAGGQDPWQAAASRSDRIQRQRRRESMWVTEHE